MIANRKIARFVSTIDEMDKKGIRLSGMILSHPGLGKTSTMQMYCDCKGYNLVTLIPSSYASDDILGLQTVIENKMVRLTPSWFNHLLDVASNGKRTILFIDELSTCDAFIQAPLLDLIFSRKLGEVSLPKDVLVIASGNYSEDLNGEFKMSAPMVNRFVLLNLSNNDVDIMEIMEDKFNSLKTKAEKEKYLGINCKEGDEYSFSSFKKWVTDNNEIQLGVTCTTESDEYGLLGFTSIRSIAYVMKFTEQYVSMYNDTYWMEMVGDTLGMSNKRENTPMRKVFLAYENAFHSSSSNEDLGIAEICRLAISTDNGLTNTVKARLEQAIKNTSKQDITDEDMEELGNLFVKYRNDDGVRKILDVYTKKFN